MKTKVLIFCSLWLPLPAFAAPVEFKGTVLAPDGSPVADARIWVQSSLRPQPPVDAVESHTTADGGFKIMVDYENPAKEVAALALVFSPRFAAGQFTLSAQDNQLRLKPATMLRGEVKDSQGQPVSGARVRLSGMYDEEGADRVLVESFGKSAREAFTVRSGADGSWNLPGARNAGRGTLRLLDERFIPQYQQVELSETEVVAPVFEAKPGATVSGQVKLPTGEPAAGILVAAVTKTGSRTSDEVLTTVDGRFSLSSLSPGSFHIQARDQASNWVAVPVPVEVALPGVTVPPISLIPGIEVEVPFVDAETGAPLAGAQVAISSAYTQSASESGADGISRVRVAPGKLRFYIYKTPRGYLGTDHRRYVDNSFEIGANETTRKIPPFKLQRGAPVAGIAVDEDGNPAVGATLKIGDFSFWGDQVVVSKTGEWGIEAIQPGTVKLGAEGEWELIGPKEINVGKTGAKDIELKLRRIKLQTLTGRAVTPAGEPVAGVQISFSLPVDGQEGSFRHRQATTNKDGVFVLRELRPGQKIQVVESKKPGFRLVSGGVLSEKDGQRQLSDLVFAALNGQVAGKVVDVAGAPVTGAHVAVLEGEAQSDTVTDAGGRFKIEGLPVGEVHAVAAHGFSAARTTANTGTETSLQLTPESALDGGEADWRRAVNLLQELPAQQRVQHAWLLGKRDLDAGLKLAEQTSRGKGWSRVEILTNLARRDPATAARRGPVLIAEIEDPYTRLYGATSLGQLLVKTHPETATELLVTASALLKPNESTSREAGNVFQVAALAAKLGRPEATALAARGLDIVKRLPEKERGERSVGMLMTTALGGSQLLEQALVEQEPPLQVHLLGYAIPMVARDDPREALRLLERLRGFKQDPKVLEADAKPRIDNAMYQPRWSDSYNDAVSAVVRYLAPLDRVAANGLAREVTNELRKPRALIHVAQAYARAGDKPTAIKLLQEAVDTSPTHWVHGATQAAAVASLIDAAAGDALFTKVRDKILGDQERGFPGQKPSLAEWALARAHSNPAASRVVLEREWAQGWQQLIVEQPQGKVQEWNGPYPTLWRVARAMGAVDVDRALEWGQMLDGVKVGGEHRFNTADGLRTKIAVSLATPLAERVLLHMDATRIDDEE